uniref:Lipoprotein n=1 Tax=Haemonchus contortus TaxID=6289 RepID=A0A6F7PMD2_HAECO
MLRVVIFLSFLAFSLACKPSNSTSGSGSGASGGNKTKRGVEEAHVLVETNLKFNEALNPIFERAFRQGVEQHAHRHGFKYHHDMIDGRTAKIGHKFGMAYKVLDADCKQLEKFIKKGKKETDLVGVVFTMCDGQPNIL